MTEDEILAEFRAADALLEGHFILSSGLHSPRYLQCARVLMDPARASRLAAALAATHPARDSRSRIEIVVSPAMGGVIIGHEMGRALGRRGDVRRAAARARSSCAAASGSSPGQKVLMVEDVVTTGLSSREAIEAIEEAGGEVIAAAALVDRSGGTADLGVPFFPLIRLDVPTYAPTRCRPSSPRSRPRSPGAATGGVTGTLAPRRQYRPCRDHPERARRRLIPIRCAPPIAAAEAGADGITAHLREDRRHITDARYRRG